MSWRRLTVSIAALLVPVLSPGLAVAGGPGTGIVPQREEVSARELGYTTAYASEKAAAAAPNRGVGSRRAGPAGMVPMYEDPDGGGSWPASKILDFTIFHQKTNYYCLPAVGQSIAHHAFGNFNTPSVEERQHSIAEAMGTTSEGTIGSNGLAWLNQKFANQGWAWRYVPYASPNLETFRSHVKYDVAGYGLPMYVTVDLSSGHYPWSQGAFALHATLATGYSSSGTNVRSADPFAHKRANGTCTAAWDGGVATRGCIWGEANGPYKMSDYFLAVGGVDPEWF